MREKDRSCALESVISSVPSSPAPHTGWREDLDIIIHLAIYQSLSDADISEWTDGGDPSDRM